MKTGPRFPRADPAQRNSPYAPRVLDIYVVHTVGSLRPVPHTRRDKLDARLANMWEEWQQSADVEGMLSPYAQQCLAVRSTIESGEIVGRFIDMPLEKRTTQAGRRQKIFSAAQS